MTFQPVLVGSGLVGWQFLKATQARQREVFDTSPALARDTDYFAAKIGEVESAEQLVGDRRLLRVALGAFGLGEDIDSRAFIQKVLAEGVEADDALANKLTDDRYKALARAFAFDNPEGPQLGRSGFAESIVSQFRAQQFEIAIGTQDETLRLAMNAERALPEISAGSGSDDAKWFRVMGTPPLRKVLETALGLPPGFGKLDIDQQLEVFRDKAESRFGAKEIDDLIQPEVMKRVVQTYLLQSQVRDIQKTSAGTVALSLLQSIPKPSLLG